MEHHRNDFCPDCDPTVDRRDFLRTVGVGAAAATAAGVPLFATPKALAAPTPKSPAETAVKGLYESLTPEQKKVICFDWDYSEPGTGRQSRGLLRTHVSNNWQITEPHIRSSFYTKKQQAIIHDIFKQVLHPDWYARVLKQLKDDTGGREWGAGQSIALFGVPGSAKFEFVMTGRHMTLRADGNTEDHVAFGGPIFYGHAASGFNEKVHHPGNVYWPQAVQANKVFQVLAPELREKAMKENRPRESAVDFRGPKGTFTGVAVSELSSDARKELQKTLRMLIEHYRKADQMEAMACLKAQGGLDKCHLTYYNEGDLGNDGEWDNWRLEGPAFVWYFRGTPHVHVWVNVADDPSVKLNSRG
jgi:hypothetical protein